MGNYNEIDKKIKEFSTKFLSSTPSSMNHENDVLNLNMKKMHEILHTLIYESHTVIEIIGESHLAFFYPIPYFKLETLNKALAENEKFMDLSFHWITLKVIADPDFNTKYLTAFDFQILSFCAEKLISNLLSDQILTIPQPSESDSDFQDRKEVDDFDFPEYAALLLDDREHVKYCVEGQIGMMLQNGSDEKWSYYKVYDLEFPSNEELKHIKGIVLPGSKYSAYDSTVTWIEPLKEFIRKVYNEYEHIRMAGICFGNQILAQALGGRVERMQNLDGRPLYIGRETINVQDTFFKLPWVQEIMKNSNQSALEQLNPMYINEVHGDHVALLPEGAILHGSSDRTSVEIWTLKDRIFAMQAHPELPSSCVEDLIINKLYDLGRLDDALKAEALEQIYDPSKPLCRNLMLKFIEKFLKRGDQE